MEPLGTCYYHALTGWKEVAATSVRLFRAYRNRRMSHLNVALERLDVDPHVCWLFHDPIVWGGENPYLTNGQHRTCAIRASGARLCVIDHDRLEC